MAVSQSPNECLQTKTTLISRNITVLGKRTSVRLEPEMWSALKEISKRERCKIHDICSLINLRKNEQTSLTAAIRVFLMLYYRAASTEDGHRRAGHGDFANMLERAQVRNKTLDHLKSQKLGAVKNPDYSKDEDLQSDDTGDDSVIFKVINHDLPRHSMEHA